MLPEHTIVIATWNDLQPYGINFLTAERCGWEYRLLCDLDEKGMTLIKKLFDFEDVKFMDPWGGGKAAIMLSPEMLTPLAVAAVMVLGKVDYCWILKDGGVLVPPTEYPKETYEVYKNEIRRRVPAFDYAGPKSADGSAKVHTMSGRE